VSRYSGCCVGEDFEEAGIPIHAADVFGWAGACTVRAGSHTRCRLEHQQALELDRVFPVVAEVVDVDQADVLPTAEVEQPHLGFVEPAGVTLELRLTDLRITVRQATDAELVEMVVPPTEGRLDDAMQLTQVEDARDNEASPGHWLDAGQRDTQLDRVGGLEHRDMQYDGRGDKKH